MAPRILQLQHLGAQGNYDHASYKDSVYISWTKFNAIAGFGHNECQLINVNPQFRLNHIRNEPKSSSVLRINAECEFLGLRSSEVIASPVKR